MISNSIFMCTEIPKRFMKPMKVVGGGRGKNKWLGGMGVCIKQSEHRKCSSNKYDEKSLETRHQLCAEEKLDEIKIG